MIIDTLNSNLEVCMNGIHLCESCYKIFCNEHTGECICDFEHETELTIEFANNVIKVMNIKICRRCNMDIGIMNLLGEDDWVYDKLIQIDTFNYQKRDRLCGIDTNNGYMLFMY